MLFHLGRSLGWSGEWVRKEMELRQRSYFSVPDHYIGKGNRLQRWCSQLDSRRTCSQTTSGEEKAVQGDTFICIHGYWRPLKHLQDLLTPLDPVLTASCPEGWQPGRSSVPRIGTCLAGRKSLSHSNQHPSFFSSHVTQTTSWIHPVMSVLNLSCSEENEEDCPRELTDQKSWWKWHFRVFRLCRPGAQPYTRRHSFRNRNPAHSARRDVNLELWYFYAHVKDQLPTVLVLWK